MYSSSFGGWREQEQCYLVEQKRSGNCETQTTGTPLTEPGAGAGNGAGAGAGAGDGAGAGPGGGAVTQDSLCLLKIGRLLSATVGGIRSPAAAVTSFSAYLSSTK